MAEAQTLPDAAAALGEKPGTLRRWVREGCPTVRRGERGRGNQTLVDIDQVREWQALSDREQIFIQLATVLPNIMADGVLKDWQTFGEYERKKRLGLELAAGWYSATKYLLEHLRKECSAVPYMDDIGEPLAITELKK